MTGSEWEVPFGPVAPLFFPPHHPFPGQPEKKWRPLRGAPPLPRGKQKVVQANSSTLPHPRLLVPAARFLPHCARSTLTISVPSEASEPFSEGLFRGRHTLGLWSTSRLQASHIYSCALTTNVIMFCTPPPLFTLVALAAQRDIRCTIFRAGRTASRRFGFQAALRGN